MARHETSGNSGTGTQRVVAAVARVTNVIPRLAQSLDTLGAVSSWRAWCLRNGMGRSYDTREALWSGEVLPRLVPPPDSEESITIFEFGVAFGEATRWWLDRIDSPHLRYHGFDRFTGLPQRWRGMPAGAFDADGRTPAIDDARVTWHVGDVEDSLGDIEWATTKGRRFFNFDLDLFRPSLAAWEAIAPSLETGDIFWFDEAFDSDERLLLEAYVMPTGRFEGLGFSPFGGALIVS
ncbi:MAG: hypothetical protein FGM58_00745 [Acidimicrobiia bacterium]|nr:hypothetical protein [Acidimicrobiia bacterium]